MESIKNESLLSLAAVAACAGQCANTILASAKAGSFPSSVQFDDGELWLSSEIANWLETQPHNHPATGWEIAA